MQYEQTTAHMEDSSNHSSVCFKCHPEHTSVAMLYYSVLKCVVLGQLHACAGGCI